MTIEARIKDYVSKSGLKQTYLSEKTGIAANKLSLTLNGHRRLTFPEYELICGALEIPVDKFLKPRTVAISHRGF